jgi:DNA polymerase-3 subunit gamma/tau
MRGTTPTRLQLELVCARLMLPGVADDLSDVQARLDRMERTLAHAGAPRPPSAAALDAAAGLRAAPRAPVATAPPEAAASAPVVAPRAVAAAPAQRPEPLSEPPVGDGGSRQPASSDGGLAEVRRAWPEVLERLRELRKTPWTFIKDNTEPIGVSGDVLSLGVRSPRLRDMFAARDDYSGYLQQALLDTLGRQWRLEAVVHPGASDGSPAAPTPAPPQRGNRPRRSANETPVPSASSEGGVDPDDQVLDEVSGADLLSRELGASVIEVVDEP